MKAMILAAGFGTRLWPLTEDRTKPAVPFLGKPLVAYSVEYVRRYGVEDVVVNLHHRPESVRGALGDGSAFGVRIVYSEEPEILGTGGALDRVRGLLEDDDFVVVNGKIVTDLDLGAAIAAHRDRGAVATLVLMSNERRERFSEVECDETGAIRRFGAHPAPGDGPAPLMFTGIQICSPRVFEYIPRERFSHTTTDAYPAAIAAGELVLGHVARGVWRELSTLERYLAESLAAARERGEAAVVDPGAAVEAGAEVVDSVLWRGARVAAGAVVQGSILGEGVRIAPGEHVEDSVVVRAAIVRDFERGRVEGDNLVAPIRPVLD
jgi:NDP-sugar pyrophosphorylase family protein